MNINSSGEWIALIITSAGTSTAINVAWNAWTRHQDKKRREQNAYLDISSDLEDYSQACINRIEYNEEYFTYFLTNQEYTNKEGEAINTEMEPPKVKTPEPPLAQNNKSLSENISTRDRSRIKDFISYTTETTKSATKEFSKHRETENLEEIAKIYLDFEKQLMATCGLEASRLAKDIRKKSGAPNKSIDKKIKYFESIIEEQKNRHKNRQDLLLAPLRTNS